MKKFIFMSIMAIAMMFSTVVNAQSNYAGSSKFTDNVSVTLQGGVLTTFNDFYTNHTMMAPVAVLGVDKYVNPWLGIGVEARTLIGTGKVGEARFNSKTAFDAVNVSSYVKFNIMNMLDFDGTRKFFEPVIYTGLGWGHRTSSEADTYSVGTHEVVNSVYGSRNFMTYRAGVEFNFNLGKERAWAFVVNPSVVWGDICNGRLDKKNGNFEITAGFVYHIGTSNGTSSFNRAKLYDKSKEDALKTYIVDLEKEKANTNSVKEVKVVEKVVHDTLIISPKIQFVKGSSVISPTSIVNVNDIADFIKDNGKTYNIIGYASVEGNETTNLNLSQDRANAVKDALIKAGVSEDKLIAIGKGATTQFGDEFEDNRIVLVENK